MLLSEFENATVAEADFFGRYAEIFAGGGARSPHDGAGPPGDPPPTPDAKATNSPSPSGPSAAA